LTQAVSKAPNAGTLVLMASPRRVNMPRELRMLPTSVGF
jgi:hypothetical protein